MSGPPLPQRFGGGLYEQPPPPTQRRHDPTALERPLTDLPGVTATQARRLTEFGLSTVGELIEHFPRRYEDFRDRKPMRDLKVGEEATIRGEVVRVRAERTARRRIDVVHALLRDDTGHVDATWFNQRYLTKVLDEGMWLSVRGTYRPQGGRPSFLVKGHEVLGCEGDEGLHTEGVVPVYAASERVSARLLRSLLREVAPAIRRLPDPLPADLLTRERLPLRGDAMTAVHLPRTPAEARHARRRLILEELLLLQIGLLLHKREQQVRCVAPALPPAGAASKAFLDGLPFTLTAAQRDALAEIDGDLRREVPMRRLLQGDVGSGKTVIALYCLLRAAEAGLQGVLLAPTETLAAQHAATVARLVGGQVTSELFTASAPAAQRRASLRRLAAGEIQLAIGTHALLQEEISFAALGLLVVDEQHRFGVEQRDALVHRAERRGCAPHALHMTATPIPRTLALTLFGDLDLTVIDGLPPGRRPVRTELLEEGDRERGYRFVREELAAGRQVYVVCPAIDESETISAAAAVAEAERLRSGPLREARIAVAHGQLKWTERDEVMRAFRDGELDVLVSTSLIEVGIDVPNATVMIIEGAERFGLAQLHQLRGRVGRGAEQSHCLLFATTETPAAQARLQALLETRDGFELADKDLAIRGEGQVLGARQAGLSGLKLARLARDRGALLRARALAAEILATDPGLDEPRHAPLRDAVTAAFGDELDWLLKA